LQEQLLITLDVIGIIAFALSGFIIAAKNKLDLFGIVCVAFLASFGGGLIRDIFVGKMPFIFAETYPLIVLLITVSIAFVFNLHKHTKLTNNYVFLLSDSIGLAVCAVTGATIGLDAKFNLGGVVILALVTAVGGGVIRDVILNTIPFVFRADFYGMIAVFIGIVVWLCNHFYELNSISLASIIVFGFITRLMAIKWKWHLPPLTQ